MGWIVDVFCSVSDRVSGPITTPSLDLLETWTTFLGVLKLATHCDSTGDVGVQWHVITYHQAIRTLVTKRNIT